MIFRYLVLFCLLFSGCKQVKKDNLGQIKTDRISLVEKIEPIKVKQKKNPINNNLIGLKRSC